MSQEEIVGPLEDAVGYMLKQASSALRSRIDVVLRPLELTVPQYACLEVIDQRPGVSGADLARATFVTRQSMNLVVQGLLLRGLLSRAEVATHGRALPTELTDSGRVVLREASIAVRDVERAMLSGLSDAGQRRLATDLALCVAGLHEGPGVG